MRIGTLTSCRESVKTSKRWLMIVRRRGGVHGRKILQLGNAFCRSATPASVAWVSQRFRICSTFRPLRCTSPAATKYCG